MVVGIFIVSGIPLSETYYIELSAWQTITKRLSEWIEKGLGYDSGPGNFLTQLKQYQLVSYL